MHHRKPIELVLYCVLAGLILFAAWSIWTASKAEPELNNAPQTEISYQPGTHDEISNLTAESLEAEENLFEEDDNYDEFADSVDAGVTNVNVSYDETAF